MVVSLILKYLVKRCITVTILVINPLLFLTSDFIIMNMFNVDIYAVIRVNTLKKIKQTLLRHTINVRTC